MLFEEETIVSIQPSSKVNFEGNKEIYSFHHTLTSKNFPHGMLLPSIYSDFPELLDNLIKSINSDEVDKFELKQNENGNILMESLLECITFAQKTSFIGKKIIIINNVCELSLNVSNALLKVLEEPPKDTIFFLTYRVKSLILPTIASRCLLVEFKNSKENFDFIFDNFINNSISKSQVASIVSSQINLISLFKDSETQSIINDFNNLINNFGYINFKSFFVKYCKQKNQINLIYLLIENKIKELSYDKMINLQQHFIFYKRCFKTYNINLELFLYYIINRICL